MNPAQTRTFLGRHVATFPTAGSDVQLDLLNSFIVGRPEFSGFQAHRVAARGGVREREHYQAFYVTESQERSAELIRLPDDTQHYFVTSGVWQHFRYQFPTQIQLVEVEIDLTRDLSAGLLERYEPRLDFDEHEETGVVDFSSEQLEALFDTDFVVSSDEALLLQRSLAWSAHSMESDSDRLLFTELALAIGYGLQVLKGEHALAIELHTLPGYQLVTTQAVDDGPIMFRFLSSSEGDDAFWFSTTEVLEEAYRDVLGSFPSQLLTNLPPDRHLVRIRSLGEIVAELEGGLLLPVDEHDHLRFYQRLTTEILVAEAAEGERDQQRDLLLGAGRIHDTAIGSLTEDGVLAEGFWPLPAFGPYAGLRLDFEYDRGGFVLMLDFTSSLRSRENPSVSIGLKNRDRFS